MAKTLGQFVTDIRGYLAKGKVKAARKTYEKCVKSGLKGPQLLEAQLELLLAEGGGSSATRILKEIAAGGGSRLAGALKTIETHLRQTKDDHVMRDMLWEYQLSRGEYEQAIQHLSYLLRENAIDAQARAQVLLGRRDAVGATGIFLIASLGAIKTDLMKLADRLLQDQNGVSLLGGLVNAMHAQGHEGGALNYVLAQLAKLSGDREQFLEYAERAFEDNPDELWTWTLSNVAPDEQLEIAMRKGTLRHVLQAADKADPKVVVTVAKKSSGEGSASRGLRGLALLVSEKTTNACRVLETVASEDPEAVEPLLGFLAAKADEVAGAKEVFAAVVVAAAAGNEGRVAEAVDALLTVPEAQRDEAWLRSAAGLAPIATAREDLWVALGVAMLAAGDTEGAAGLLRGPEQLGVARAWAAQGATLGPTVLLRAAELAQEADALATEAEWMLAAAQGDPDLLGELGRKLGGAGVSADTAIRSAETLLSQGQGSEAAKLLARLPLDPDTGGQVQTFLSAHNLTDERDFALVSFRNALALGDANRARRLQAAAEDEERLVREASAFAGAGLVLAEILTAAGKIEPAATILEARRAAGDKAQVLRPRCDALLKKSPGFAKGRLLRARVAQALGRDVDAVRDLRTIAPADPDAEQALELLGGLAEGEAGGVARLGRADIHLGRKRYAEAVKELAGSDAPAAERLERFDQIVNERADSGAGYRGRALCLFEMDRIPEAADSHLRRFRCRDDHPSAVATDLEQVAKAALEKNDIETATRILEQLPDQVSDGAERALKVIGEDARASMLIQRSRLLLHLGRAGEAVRTLVELVRTDETSRVQAAKALEAIIESGQARPEADFALSQAHEALDSTTNALAALARLYKDDITSKENVVRAAQQLLVKADDAEVRLFLGRVCIDMRDAAGATESAVHARRLRPGARRECVALLRRALELDSQNPDTHFALAEAHLAGDEGDDAVRHLRSSVEIQRTRARDAIRVMEEAAPRSKNQGLLWLAVGTTYADFVKDHKSAVQSYTNGLESKPPEELHVPLLLGRGDSYAKLQDDHKAYDDFDAAAQLATLERRYYEFLRSRHRMRVLAEAEEAAGAAGKDFAKAAEACGKFILLGKPDLAVQVAQDALASAPGDFGPRYLSGVALHAAGRYDAAANVLETVRTAAGADTAIGRAARMLLAESYLDSGDRAHARICLTEIEAVDAAYPGLKARRGALAPPADDPHAPPPLLVRPQFPRPSG